MKLTHVPREDAQTYFFRKGVPDITEEMVGRLWDLAGGRPLLMDLAVDWLKQNIDYQRLVDIPQERFEEELISKVRELRGPQSRAILYMAWAHRRMDVEMLEWLMRDETVDYPALVAELSHLSFVKYREPIQSFLLHDKMRELVVRYVWGSVDPMGTERIALSQRILSYYDECLIPKAAGDHEREVLNAEKLFYALYLDLGEGYQRFTEVFDDLFERQHYDDCETLLVEIAFYKDRLPLERANEAEYRRAKILQQRNRLDEAIVLLDRIIQLQPDSELKIHLYFLRRDCRIRTGKIHEAQSDTIDASNLCQRISVSADVRGKALSEAGYLNRVLGRWEEAIRLYQQALEVAEEGGKVADILNTLGYINALRTDYDTALEYCRQGLRLRQQLGRKKGEGLSLSTLGEVYRYREQYREALNYYQQALQIFERGRDEENIARVLQQRGICYVLMWQFEEAEADLRSAVNFYETSGNIRDYPRCLERLARLHYARKEYAEARIRFETAYQEGMRILDVDTAVFSLVGLTQLALEQGSSSKVIADYREQLEKIVDEHKYQNPQHQGQIKVLVASALSREGRWHEALPLFADGMADIAGQRRGSYLVQDYLKKIEEQVAQLPSQEVIQWCDYLKREWQNRGLQDIHPELISFCEIQRRIASLAAQGG